MSARTLHDWLARLERLHPREIDLGLDRIRAVAENLGWGPSWKPAPQVVTIAGTNGKGSTLGLMETLLTEAGVRVGSYSSPHLVRYNERVRIQGKPVSDAELCDAFAYVEQAREGIRLTYFEFGTLAALRLIAKAQVNVALLEVGLGGRLDAVNLIDPTLAIITGIALDHMDWLGDTRDAIGAEKAGILRPDVPAVIGDPDPPNSILDASRQVHAQVVFADRDFRLVREPGRLRTWQGLNRSAESISIGDLPESSLHPRAIASALQAYALLQPEQDSGAVIRAALRRCSIPGRCQQFEVQGQRIVVDVSHNPEAAQHLADYLNGLDIDTPASGTRRVLIGMLRDKAIAGTIAPLAAWADEWHCVGSPGERGLSASDLAAAVQTLTDKPVQIATDPESALRQILSAGRPGDRLAGFGSFSVAGRLIGAFAEMGHS